MKLSILIPTHKRPNLFFRCLESVQSLLKGDVEVIVNNDSDDIIPKHYHPNISYYYNKFDNLSQVYQFLLSKATGEYVYFLEDDDYLTSNFNVELDSDIIVGNYMPMFDPVFKFDAMTYFKNGKHTPSEFKGLIDEFLLQLSQYIFKRKVIENFDFPMDNNIHNDLKLVLHACNNSFEVKTLNKIFYHQTQDGGDNISFPESSK